MAGFWPHLWQTGAPFEGAPAPYHTASYRLERRRIIRPTIDHLVDHAPFDRHLGGQEVVALECVLDLLERLAGVLHVDIVESLLDVQDLLSMQHDIGRLALEPA